MESTTNELKKIILVDDDEDLLYTFNYWLMSKGFVTIALTEPDSITSYIADFHPSLILIDIHLKNRDGRKVCQHIKKDLQFNRPVLLYSSREYSEADYKDSSADGFFLKTSDHLTMIHYISQFL